MAELRALIEAYAGVFEAQHERDYRPVYDKQIAEEIAQGADVVESWEGWLETNIIRHQIYADSPKERLAVYLQWNGIVGYTETIWAITQGKV